MNTNEDLAKYREQIDEVDQSIVKLFEKRMKVAKEIGDYKRENNVAILDSDREQKVVDNVIGIVDEDLRGEVTLLMRTIMSLARGYQRSFMFQNELEMLPAPVPRKSENVKCVFQGQRGAWSEQATEKLFPDANIVSAAQFEDVFRMVKDGEADYGVVPIENSKTGAIGETYDLLRTYGCYIVGRTWIDIKHCLLAKPGAEIKDIREVYSHPEGFRQCLRFLSDKSWDLIASSNTAVAAGKVGDSEDIRLAAIGSRRAAELNGLNVLAEDIMDSDKNRTSFVVIAAQPEYDEKSDLISVTFSAAHRAGSLCEALLPFTAAGINLSRIESRPSSSNNYRFFAEVNGNICDPEMIETLKHAAGATDYFEVIGCYKQV